MARRHVFNDRGTFLRPHHLTDYVYPDLSLLPNSNAQVEVACPYGHLRRFAPGPQPADSQRHLFYTVSELPPRDGRVAYREIDDFSQTERIQEALDRVSAYPGQTTLSMIIYSENGEKFFHIGRRTRFQNGREEIASWRYADPGLRQVSDLSDHKWMLELMHLRPLEANGAQCERSVRR